MCLTLANAAAIHHHTDPTGTAVRGYTSTSHRAALRSTSPVTGHQARPAPATAENPDDTLDDPARSRPGESTPH